MLTRWATGWAACIVLTAAAWGGEPAIVGPAAIPSGRLARLHLDGDYEAVLNWYVEPAGVSDGGPVLGGKDYWLTGPAGRYTVRAVWADWTSKTGGLATHSVTIGDTPPVPPPFDPDVTPDPPPIPPPPQPRPIPIPPGSDPAVVSLGRDLGAGLVNAVAKGLEAGAEGEWSNVVAAKKINRDALDAAWKEALRASVTEQARRFGAATDEPLGPEKQKPIRDFWRDLSIGVRLGGGAR